MLNITNNIEQNITKKSEIYDDVNDFHMTKPEEIILELSFVALLVDLVDTKQHKIKFDQRRQQKRSDFD